jgi:hypothetical protein
MATNAAADQWRVQRASAGDAARLNVHVTSYNNEALSQRMYNVIFL